MRVAGFFCIIAVMSKGSTTSAQRTSSEFKASVEQHRSAVRALAQTLTRNFERAEVLTTHVLTAAVAERSSYNPDEMKLSTWLLKRTRAAFTEGAVGPTATRTDLPEPARVATSGPRPELRPSSVVGIKRGRAAAVKPQLPPAAAKPSPAPAPRPAPQPPTRAAVPAAAKAPAASERLVVRERVVSLSPQECRKVVPSSVPVRKPAEAPPSKPAASSVPAVLGRGRIIAVPSMDASARPSLLTNIVVRTPGARDNGELKRIDPTPFLEAIRKNALDKARKSGLVPATRGRRKAGDVATALELVDVGTPPQLAWLPIADLRIDLKYQREILRRGRANVIKIASEFHWTKFVPVIVAPLGDGLYVIVDGQHRTTSAACIGILEVPCQIIQADAAQQAAAFAAINGNVTQMTPLQLHAARVAAKDRTAIKLDRVCAEAGVTILRYPVPASNIKAGETLAVSSLAASLKSHGPDVLRTALMCVAESGDGNAGMLRASVIRALCTVLGDRPSLVERPKRAIEIAERIDFEKLHDEAAIEAKINHRPVAPLLAARFARRFGASENRTV